MIVALLASVAFGSFDAVGHPQAVSASNVRLTVVFDIEGFSDAEMALSSHPRQTEWVCFGSLRKGHEGWSVHRTPADSAAVKEADQRWLNTKIDLMISQIRQQHLKYQGGTKFEELRRVLSKDDELLGFDEGLDRETHHQLQNDRAPIPFWALPVASAAIDTLELNRKVITTQMGQFPVSFATSETPSAREVSLRAPDLGRYLADQRSLALQFDERKLPRIVGNYHLLPIKINHPAPSAEGVLVIRTPSAVTMDVRFYDAKGQMIDACPFQEDTLVRVFPRGGRYGERGTGEKISLPIESLAFRELYSWPTATGPKTEAPHPAEISKDFLDPEDHDPLTYYVADGLRMLANRDGCDGYIANVPDDALIPVGSIVHDGLLDLGDFEHVLKDVVGCEFKKIDKTLCIRPTNPIGAAQGHVDRALLALSLRDTVARGYPDWTTAARFWAGNRGSFSELGLLAFYGRILSLGRKFYYFPGLFPKAPLQLIGTRLSLITPGLPTTFDVTADLRDREPLTELAQRFALGGGPKGLSDYELCPVQFVDSAAEGAITMRVNSGQIGGFQFSIRLPGEPRSLPFRNYTRWLSAEDVAQDILRFVPPVSENSFEDAMRMCGFIYRQVHRLEVSFQFGKFALPEQYVFDDEPVPSEETEVRFDDLPDQVKTDLRVAYEHALLTTPIQKRH